MVTDTLVEQRRSASIRLYGLDSTWDHVASEELDAVVRLLQESFGCEGTEINLMVDDEQVTVATTGTRTGPIERDCSVCSNVLAGHPDEDVVDFVDLRAEPDLVHNPFVDGTLARLRFYAMTPLVGKHGLALGTLCAWSSTPQQIDDRQRQLLRQLGRSVVNVLDERRRVLVPDGQGALRTGPLRLREAAG